MGNRASWRRADSVALLVVVLGAVMLRGLDLRDPPQVYDEGYYLADACLIVGGTAEQCGRDDLYSQHPPLGTWLMGLPIRVLDYRPGAGRIAAVVAGVVTVAALYLLARRLFGSTLGATVAAGLFSLDFLHYVHSRIGMLDVFFGLFTVLGFLFYVHDRDSSHRRPGRRESVCPWRLAAGFAAGAAIATKWSGAAVILALLVLTFHAEMRSRTHRGRPQAALRTLREEGPSLALAFAAIPVIVYLAAHMGTLDGTILAWPWEEGSWYRSLVARQIDMATFHASVGDLGERNPYTSAAWSWPLVKRPVLYYFDDVGVATRRILAMGNPLVWWTSLLAVAAAGAQLIRRRDVPATTVIVAGFLVGWAPWVLLSAVRDYMFLFYILPAVPFMCLALGWAAVRVSHRLLGRAAVGGFIVAAVGSFALYQPLLTGRPLDDPVAERLLLFDDCASMSTEAGRETAAFVEPTRSSAGWCWS